jgi:hypothetical protein
MMKWPRRLDTPVLTAHLQPPSRSAGPPNHGWTMGRPGPCPRETRPRRDGTGDMRSLSSIGGSLVTGSPLRWWQHTSRKSPGPGSPSTARTSTASRRTRNLRIPGHTPRRSAKGRTSRSIHGAWGAACCKPGRSWRQSYQGQETGVKPSREPGWHFRRVVFCSGQYGSRRRIPRTGGLGLLTRTIRSAG